MWEVKLEVLTSIGDVAAVGVLVEAGPGSAGVEAGQARVIHSVVAVVLAVGARHGHAALIHVWRGQWTN